MVAIPVKQAGVLVLGANGRFGAAATDAFAAAGWRVFAQSRRASSGPLPDGVSALHIDLADADALVCAVGDVAAVVHAVNGPYPRWAVEALPQARLGMALAQRLGAVFMLPGNVYNFGAAMPPLLLPDTPQRPTTRLGEIRCAIEAEMQARAQDGLQSVVIRAGDFFGGAGRGNWFDRVLVQSIAAGKLVYPGPLDRTHAWAYLPDLARSFVAAAAHREALPPFVQLHFEGHSATGAEWLAAIRQAAEAIGVRPARAWRTGGLPWPLLRLAGVVSPTWRAVTSLEYLWRVPHRLDGDAMRRVLGELPMTDRHAALCEALVALGLGAAEPTTTATTTRKAPAPGVELSTRHPPSSRGSASARKSYTVRTSRLPRISRCTASQHGSGATARSGSSGTTPGSCGTL